jgi:hypothetical protein
MITYRTRIQPKRVFLVHISSIHPFILHDALVGAGSVGGRILGTTTTTTTLCFNQLSVYIEPLSSSSVIISVP